VQEFYEIFDPETHNIIHFKTMYSKTINNFELQVVDNNITYSKTMYSQTVNDLEQHMVDNNETYSKTIYSNIDI
jgi:hypothetical protein